MSDEKFISIPYSIWNSKYKKIEEELASFKDQLEKEKANKLHNLYIDIKKFYPTWHSQTYDSKKIYLGTFEIGIDRFSWTKRIDLSVMKEAIKSIIQETQYFNGDYQLTMPSVEELAKCVEKLNKGHALFLQKSEELEKRIKGLPRIVRWLFNIK